MKPINSILLLEQLEADTRQLILSINYLLQEDPGNLLQQPAEGSWSAAQAIEHLNSYGRYYLPAIEKKLNSSVYPANSFYKPGWLGNYFTRIMMPKEGQVTNKMKTPKGYRPPMDIDSKKVLDDFLAQEKLLLELLERAKQKDIGKIRIPVSLTPLIRLKLGDTFRFLVAHHQRHMLQALKALKTVTTKTGVFTSAIA